MTTWLGSPPNYTCQRKQNNNNTYQVEDGRTYRSDVLLHPLHQHPLVQQTRVQGAVIPHPLAGKKAPEGDPVVEVDRHNAVTRLLNDLGAIYIGVGVGGVSWTPYISMA